MFGWRKRIGFICPSVLEITPYDFYSMNLDGIGLVGVSCNIEGWSASEYEKALSNVLQMSEYLESRNVDYIIHSGVPLVINRGIGADQALIKEIEEKTGIPATTSVRSAIAAMQHLNTKHIAIASPYPEDLNIKTADYLQQNGFTVHEVATLGINFKRLHDVQHRDIYRFAMDVISKAPRAEALYMPCPNWPVFDVVDTIERDGGIPVVAGDNADFWAALKHLGVRDEINGYGVLLNSLSH